MSKRVMLKAIADLKTDPKPMAKALNFLRNGNLTYHDLRDLNKVLYAYKDGVLRTRRKELMRELKELPTKSPEKKALTAEINRLSNLYTVFMAEYKPKLEEAEAKYNAERQTRYAEKLESKMDSAVKKLTFAYNVYIDAFGEENAKDLLNNYFNTVVRERSGMIVETEEEMVTS